MTAVTAIDIVMPQMGVSVEEGTIVAWERGVGDAVVEGQLVCRIVTDKVDTDVYAPAAGVITELLASEGEAVAVGSPIARIDSSAAGGSEPPRTRAPVAHGSEVLAGAMIDPAAAADAALDRRHRDGRPPTSPLARRVAESLGVDLVAVRGSGRRGRIGRADVLAAAEARSAMPVPAPAVAPPPAGAVPRGYEDVPHEIVTTSPQRRAISEHMLRSRQTAAHMTTEVEVDMYRVGTVRESVNRVREAAGESRISFLSFIARAAIAALADHPDLNATFQHERMIRWREVNIGIAVDTPGGLIVPVIRGAQQLNVGGIAGAIADLAERARTRGLVPDDLRAGTFTISNPGSLGAVSAPAIINQPQVAILGTGAIARRPWVVTTADGAEAIVPRPIMRLAVTFDHRAVDGAEATRYVVQVQQHLERWGDTEYR